jgi:aerobic-type carbon monoxide dehydrogenase small subunit (CoxS/CutS family)
MTDSELISLEVNGVPCDAKAALYDTLLTVLRDQLGFTGAKRGCNQGVCGACTVLADGIPVRACLSLALDCQGRRIETVEGLCDHPRMQALQRAFIAQGAFQCAFCTPGMLISAYALLCGDRPVSDTETRNMLSGNLCRCTGYIKIIEAVMAAARDLHAGGAE